MRDEIKYAAELAELARLLGVDAQFEQAIDGVLGALRQALGVADVKDPLVESEFARARTRLQGFRESYRALHARIVSSRIPAEQLPAVIAGLSHPGTRLFREAESRINGELAHAAAALSRQMADTLLFEAPTNAPGARQ